MELLIVDKYLKCNNQTELYSSLDAAGMMMFGQPAINTEYAIYEIGDLYAGDTLLDGYHCNIRFLREPTEAELLALDPITIPEPNNPLRVWL